ncbi:LysE family transporter [Geomicrobium sp. JCM 19039]|uniref:LysE family transporter n=1 Tax=Geomicrobium sp. JCM 19039 TaxID=1460636 RepID=UPI00045F2048|nr:LysE family transporter [Geomicrobium sp. JCM 19039]GAK14411.1 threonine efflux protein [Geomicrobium sp. JCM 19039]
MTIELWITVLVVGLLIVLSPGSQWMVTIKNSLSSKTHGMFTVWGMCSGSMIHILYCLLGIGIIIPQSVLLFNLIKWLGAAYLIYLGVKALFFQKEEPGLSFQRVTSPVGLSKWTAYRNGFFTSLLNPKATLFYLSLFTQVIHPEVAIGV